MNDSTGLQVDGLRIEAVHQRRRVTIVEDIALSVERGQTVGIVGESGSGKSMVLRGIMALLPVGIHVAAGAIGIDGVELPQQPARAARTARLRRVGMILQDPGTALDPLIRVGRQIAEVRRQLAGSSARLARQEALELMDRVHIADPERRYDAFPHQLSGGQRQRLVIARALAGEPEFLLCDEPTTALDVTVQAEILALIDEIRRTRSMGVVIVSHDLAVISQLSTEIVVMRKGRILERGRTEVVLSAPKDPYTASLLDAVVELDGRAGR